MPPKKQPVDEEDTFETPSDTPKILKVIDTSRKNGFPLLCTMEKV